MTKQEVEDTTIDLARWRIAQDRIKVQEQEIKRLNAKVLALETMIILHLTLDEAMTIVTALKVADDKITRKTARTVEQKIDKAMGL